MIVSIIGGMLALDVACWGLTLRLAKPRSLRWIASVFIGSQIVGFILLVGGRILHAGHAGVWGHVMPRPLTASLYIWHFFGLGIVLILLLGALPVLLALQIRRAFFPSVAQKPDPAEGPSRTGEAEQGVSRREFLGAAAALAPPLFTLSLTSLGMAQLNQFRIRRFELPLVGLPRQLNGMTIAQVSDIHIGRFTSGAILNQIVESTNALRADLVLLTGDLIDFSLADLSEGIALVHRLEARHGVCMIEGNHDLIENGTEFERRIRASGIPFLLNETALVQVRGYPVDLLGIRWDHDRSRSRGAQIAESVQVVTAQRHGTEAFPILLAHHPHAFDAAAQAGLPLTLSGHTHGGQLMLNEQVGFGPALFRYWSGLYKRGEGRMIVSNGVGNWFPVRVNAPAEIIHLTLRAA